MKFVRLILSRAAAIKSGAGTWARTLAFHDVVVAFWHAVLPAEEAIAVIPPRGEEADGWRIQLRMAMYGTRKASQLFSEFMVGVYREASFEVLKCSRQVYYSKNSLNALHGDDTITEGSYLKRWVVYVPNYGYELVEDPKHASALVKNRNKEGAKPQMSPAIKETGKGDPAVLDLLVGEAVTEHRSDAGRVLYMAGVTQTQQVSEKVKFQHYFLKRVIFFNCL